MQSGSAILKSHPKKPLRAKWKGANYDKGWFCGACTSCKKAIWSFDKASYCHRWIWSCVSPISYGMVTGISFNIKYSFISICVYRHLIVFVKMRNIFQYQGLRNLECNGCEPLMGSFQFVSSAILRAFLLVPHKLVNQFLRHSGITQPVLKGMAERIY